MLSLQQVEAFLLVAELGSFTAAAKRLKLAQSAISYAIAALEEALGVLLFERSGRRPRLTAAGRALLEDAQRLQESAATLSLHASTLSGQVEAEVSLAVDVLYPRAHLVDKLHRFESRYPGVALRLHLEVLGGVVQLVLDGICGVGISTFPALDRPGLDCRISGTIELVAVVASDHPLARLAAPISMAALRAHRQIVLTDRSELTLGVDYGVLGAHTWRVADLSVKHELLRAGFGWGSMPRHLVLQDLERGLLTAMSTEDWGQQPQRIPTYSMERRAAPPGPAASWLMKELALE